jgi:hypothetical protein
MRRPASGARSFGAVVAGLVALATVTACGSDWTETEPEAAATTTATTTAQSSTAAATTATSSPAGDSSSSSSDGELGEDAEGRRLTLADFFEPGSQWEEERYNIADQRDVPGIGTQISGCYGFQELELRLGNNFDTLEFSVAQANDSRESDQNVSVEVLANNSQVEIRSVPFNQIQSFSIPVSGVNALKIQMSLDDRVDGCGGSVIAVLTDATLD